MSVYYDIGLTYSDRYKFTSKSLSMRMCQLFNENVSLKMWKFARITMTIAQTHQLWRKKNCLYAEKNIFQFRS